MFQEMHIGALMGRDKELFKHCEGIISNVMEYAECSKIPLMTIADYLWNPLKYNPEPPHTIPKYTPLHPPRVFRVFFFL